MMTVDYSSWFWLERHLAADGDHLLAGAVGPLPRPAGVPPPHVLAAQPRVQLVLVAGAHNPAVGVALVAVPSSAKRIGMSFSDLLSVLPSHLYAGFLSWPPLLCLLEPLLRAPPRLLLLAPSSPSLARRLR